MLLASSIAASVSRISRRETISVGSVLRGATRGIERLEPAGGGCLITSR
jgi:hypothetical protein